MVKRLLLAALLGAVAVGGCQCPDEDLNRFDPTIQKDAFEQDGEARVDILWVIDNSESMLQEQNKVSNGFADFFGTLITSNVDYHIGVITTDPLDGGALRTYDGPTVNGCGPDCRYLTNAVTCDNPDIDVSEATNDAAEQLLLDNCQAQLVFRNLISAGIDGSPFEEGFRQTANALGVATLDEDTGLPDGVIPDGNSGFLRDDAALYIIYVSDEDEGAKEDGEPVHYYERLFEGLKGRGDERRVSVSAIVGWPKDPGIPGLDEVCPILETTFDGRQDTNDPEAQVVLEAMAGETGCEDQPDPGEDPVTRAETGGRYVELACRTGGVVTNMCDTDYTTALDSLGANAAGLKRKFILSRVDELDIGDDCVYFNADDEKLDCNQDGDLDDEGIDLAVCVLGVPLGGDGQKLLVPRSERNGWTLEPATGALNFRGKFVPAPGTTLEVEYKLRVETDPTDCSEQ